jgi:hypothetical protein
MCVGEMIQAESKDKQLSDKNCAKQNSSNLTCKNTLADQ